MPYCEYCLSTDNVQSHMIYPKRRGSNAFHRPVELRFCKVCHDKIHDLISEKDLRTVYNSRTKLFEFLEENETVFVISQDLPNADNMDKKQEVIPEEKDIF